MQWHVLRLVPGPGTVQVYDHDDESVRYILAGTADIGVPEHTTLSTSQNDNTAPHRIQTSLIDSVRGFDGSGLGFVVS